VGRRRRRNNNNIRDNDDNDDDDYHGNNRGNSVGRMRSSSVPTRQMPSRAAKLGEKRYYVPGEEDIRDYES
jgi:hypothetical protein